MGLIETELRRIVRPFNADIIWAALDGKPTIFNVDAVWQPHSHGRPRTVPRGGLAFDGTAFLAAASALAYLGTNLAAGDQRRTALAGFDANIQKRLSNPDLLLYGHSEPQKVPSTVSDAIVCASGYVYFRPATITNKDLEIGVGLTELFYPNATYPHSGLFPAMHRFRDPGFRRLVARTVDSPIPLGRYEIDPRVSVPALVAGAAAKHGLSEDAAALYLQLLCLCDVGDRQIREVNGWKPAQHKRAIAELVEIGLVDNEKKQRANRTASIPGRWESLSTPHPAIESWKLFLFDASIEGDALAAPLGRLLPVRPAHELFAQAWSRASDGLAPDTQSSTTVGGNAEDWLAAIAANPSDDEARVVYSDFLTERGDRRGELIILQTRRLEMAAKGPSKALDDLVEAEAKLLAAHADKWIDPVYSFVEGVGWDRGFISSVSIHGQKFRKNAKALCEKLPMLREVVMISGRRNHIRDFVAAPEFARIRQLDFTPDEYIREHDDLAALLAGAHFPELEWLRIGFHRAGEGVGPRAGSLLARCEKLRQLRFLEVAGQNLGGKGALALIQSKELRSLEVLRLPLNDIKSRDATKLLALLRAGALPTLRVLDLGNVVETDFVTKAVQWFRNRVETRTQREIVRVLGQRQSSPHPYASDPVEDQSSSSNSKIAQRPGFPFAAVAVTSRSKCVVCGKAIAKGSVRVGVERDHEAAGRITTWLHAGCRARCPELIELGACDLESRLVKNSSGTWPPSE